MHLFSESCGITAKKEKIWHGLMTDAAVIYVVLMRKMLLGPVALLHNTKNDRYMFKYLNRSLLATKITSLAAEKNLTLR